MTTLLYLMYGVEVLVAILLIAVILIQRSKSGGGLGGLATTSAGVEEAFGSSAGNVLVKATITLGLIFVLNTTGISICQGVQGVRENQDVLGSGSEQIETPVKKDPTSGVIPKPAPAKPTANGPKKAGTMTPPVKGPKPKKTE